MEQREGAAEGTKMKRSHHTEEQGVRAITEHGLGKKVEKIYRDLG